MRTCTYIGLLAATIAALAGSTLAQSTLLDDFEDGNNVNKLGGWWMYGGDFNHNPAGNSKIFSADETKPGEYNFSRGVVTGGYRGKAAVLDFHFGSTKPGTGTGYSNQVVIMTDLVEGAIVEATNAATKLTLDLSKATGISFYAKASKPMTIFVSQGTANITNWGYFQSGLINITTTWQLHTVKFADFVKGWQPNSPLFDLTKANTTSWWIKQDNNPGIADNDRVQLYLDEVRIDGISIEPPDVCASCMGTSGSGSGTLINDFDGADPARSNTGGYCWVENWNLSKADTGTWALEYATKGLNAQGNGAHMDFTMGDSWTQTVTEATGTFNVTVLPSMHFALAFKNKDETPTDTTYDASVTGSDGFYFDYKTDPFVEYIYFYVQTSQVFGGNAGAMPYVKLKGTAGEWKGATVKWTDLRLPNWSGLNQEMLKNIDKSRLYKVRWAYEGTKPGSGFIAVDNIYVKGASSGVLSGKQSNSRIAGLRVDNQAGNIELTTGRGPFSGRVQIHMCDGKMIAQHTVSSATNSVRIPSGNLSNGSYIVSVLPEGTLRAKQHALLVIGK